MKHAHHVVVGAHSSGDVSARTELILTRAVGTSLTGRHLPLAHAGGTLMGSSAHTAGTTAVANGSKTGSTTCSQQQKRMPLRERLPVISPSAVPAPKFSGRQRFGSRRASFWESESDQYWEKCKKNKRAKKRKALRFAAILVVLLLMAAGFWGRSKSGTE